MIDEEIVDYETAKLATENGFDTRTNKYYGETKEHSYEDVRNHGEDIVIEARPPHLKTTLYMDTHSHTTFLCYAPSQSILQKWLRDEHNIHIIVQLTIDSYEVVTHTSCNEHIIDTRETFDTYESALEKGLTEGLKLI